MQKYSEIDILEDDLYNSYPSILKLLLKDKTTKKNILWGTTDYQEYGENFKKYKTINSIDITGTFFGIVIQPRSIKSDEIKKIRIKKKGEVFTPSWICNEQNNKIDEQWFNRKNVFNKVNGKTWITNEEKIYFEKEEEWKKYVDAKRMEITCGEAPYLVSRYDSSTGKKIPIKNRIGILDRKMRIVNENALGDDEWKKWTIRAFQSVYGYEYQGDSLLIARENLLYTFFDYYIERYNKEPPYDFIKKITNIITWNIWQMDGLKNIVPYSDENGKIGTFPKIMDWRAEKSFAFNSQFEEKKKRSNDNGI